MQTKNHAVRALLFALVTIIGLQSVAVSAEATAPARGDFVGLLDSLHVRLHLLISADGSLTCTVDDPDDGWIGMACADVHVEGQNLSFTVPSASASWSGQIVQD